MNIFKKIGQLFNLVLEKYVKLILKLSDLGYNLGLTIGKYIKILFKFLKYFFYILDLIASLFFTLILTVAIFIEKPKYFILFAMICVLIRLYYSIYSTIIYLIMEFKENFFSRNNTDTKVQ